MTTGDTGVLDTPIQFIEGRPINADEDSYYDLPGRSEQSGSLYDHCVRAILKGLTKGVHGLPLIGSGDWNDGMNMVGDRGQGESIWLGFFLYDVLMRFAEVADTKGDATFAERCRTEAAQLQHRIEQQGWDGEWYRRAYFDDGTPLGSATNDECQIDSIPKAGLSCRAREIRPVHDRAWRKSIDGWFGETMPSSNCWTRRSTSPH